MPERATRKYHGTPRYKCKNCRRWLTADQFNGGLGNRCRGCDKGRKRAWRAANPKRYAMMTKCHGAIRRAIKRGEMKRPTRCAECGGGKRILGHHPNYKQPLRVVWLCDTCHAERHKEAA